jgi:serine/threonine protein kinase
MEFMGAGTLDHTLKLTKGPLPTKVLAYVARELVRGLGFLHSVGIVHRDLKPSNIVLHSNGDVKVSCFSVSLFAVVPLSSLCCCLVVGWLLLLWLVGCYSLSRTLELSNSRTLSLGVSYVISSCVAVFVV